ncbi:Retrovirus-related Pol polyprotein from transposon RE1 [Vitis vinifera]|uniref:Retrovirus-related Pol polyprotein from transposon RE1 n=1 Tax=Vitis vinifera TaxID=29760 RepID=A0A438IHK9_VITVI|nr:Retrovirus-related Pol polyprotein from transposon RE1 [Vitis vinifera]
MIETQYNAKVRVLRSDNGGEYQSSDLQKYLEGHGIIHQLLVPIHPSKMESLNEKSALVRGCSCFLDSSKNTDILLGRSNHICRILDQSGEYHKEIQTLDYDYHISKENESGQSELVNQEAGELDMSGQQFGSEDVFTEIPNQSSSVEGVLNLEPDPFMKRLPHRHNRAIPNSVQEALADPRKEASWVTLIYTVKYKADGSIERFKARLVAKGYTQTYGIDYTETFAPVAKINIVRVLLSLAANLDWPLQQFDVKNVFLHGSYLKKYIWIFHQDAWCQKSNVRSFSSSEGIFLSQRKYALDLLQETGMSGCQPVNTPIEEAHTRPDLTYALSVVSQYMHNPGEQHMNAVMRILRYLKNAPGKGILFAKNVDHQSGNLVTWKSKKQNVVAVQV